MKTIITIILITLAGLAQAAEFAPTDKYVNCVNNMVFGAELDGKVFIKIKVTKMYKYQQRFAAKYLGQSQGMNVYELKVNINSEFKHHNYQDGTRGMAQTMINIFTHATGQDWSKDLETGVKYCSGDIMHPQTQIIKTGK